MTDYMIEQSVVGDTTPRRKLIAGRAYCGWCNASEHGLTVGVYACYCAEPCNVSDCPELLKVEPPPVPRFK